MRHSATKSFYFPDVLFFSYLYSFLPLFLSFNLSPALGLADIDWIATWTVGRFSLEAKHHYSTSVKVTNGGDSSFPWPWTFCIGQSSSSSCDSRILCDIQVRGFSHLLHKMIIATQERHREEWITVKTTSMTWDKMTWQILHPPPKLL